VHCLVLVLSSTDLLHIAQDTVGHTTANHLRHNWMPGVMLVAPELYLDYPIATPH
jgi:hypothetical protein